MHGAFGLFGASKVDSIICCAYLPNGHFVTGTHRGDLLYWSGNQVMNAVSNLHFVSIWELFATKAVF
jgi:hypothetical protein